MSVEMSECNFYTLPAAASAEKNEPLESKRAQLTGDTLPGFLLFIFNIVVFFFLCRERHCKHLFICCYCCCLVVVVIVEVDVLLFSHAHHGWMLRFVS